MVFFIRGEAVWEVAALHLPGDNITSCEFCQALRLFRTATGHRSQTQRPPLLQAPCFLFYRL